MVLSDESVGRTGINTRLIQTVGISTPAYIGEFVCRSAVNSSGLRLGDYAESGLNRGWNGPPGMAIDNRKPV
jgi:hypothetical protein